jgi:hypothetical protein
MQVIVMYCITEILIAITLKILLCHLVPILPEMNYTFCEVKLTQYRAGH